MKTTYEGNQGTQMVDAIRWDNFRKAELGTKLWIGVKRDRHDKILNLDVE